MPALERTTTRASHTPGPWHLSRYGNFIRHIQGDQTAPNICAVDVFGGPDGEREANARLIAAAPDLLAALQECRAAVAAAMRVIADLDMAHLVGLDVETRAQRFIDECHACGLVDGFGQRADAAIAKAEGR